jgi:hypothetical protein
MKKLRFLNKKTCKPEIDDADQNWFYVLLGHPFEKLRHPDQTPGKLKIIREIFIHKTKLKKYFKNSLIIAISKVNCNYSNDNTGNIW